MDTIFSKIIEREIPADIVYEDDECLAFRDVNPQAPVHILLIPKKPIAMLSDADVTDAPLLGHLLTTAKLIAADQGCAEAFRVVINNGAEVGQSVFTCIYTFWLAGNSRGRPGKLCAGRPQTAGDKN